MGALKECWSDPVSFWVSLGGMFKFFIPIYFYPAFFLGCYPHFSNEFGLWNGMINVVGGMISSLAGGIISDKLS
jgi:hypothetical protein